MKADRKKMFTKDPSSPEEDDVGMGIIGQITRAGMVPLRNTEWGTTRRILSGGLSIPQVGAEINQELRSYPDTYQNSYPYHPSDAYFSRETFYQIPISNMITRDYNISQYRRVETAHRDFMESQPRTVFSGKQSMFTAMEEAEPNFIQEPSPSYTVAGRRFKFTIDPILNFFRKIKNKI